MARSTRSRDFKNAEYSVTVEVSVSGDSDGGLEDKLLKFEKGKGVLGLFNEENSNMSTRSTRSQTQSEAEKHDKAEKLSDSSGEYLIISKEQFTEEFNSGIKKVIRREQKSMFNAHDVYLLEKTCELCNLIKNDHLLLLCDYCDDAYHSYCINPPLIELPPEDELWICKVCIDDRKRLKLDVNEEGRRTRFSSLRKKQTIIEDHFEVKERENDKTCATCSKVIEFKESGKAKGEEMNTREYCVKCQGYFHSECFGTKTNKIVCGPCDKKIKKIMPKNEKTLHSYFKTVTKRSFEQFDKKAFDETLSEDPSLIKKMRLSSPMLDDGDDFVTKLKRTRGKKRGRRINSQKKRPIFKLPMLTDDPAQLKQQKEMFFFALKAKSIEFDDDLRFNKEGCPPSSNNASLEPKLQKIGKDNYEVFLQFKEMTRRGNYAPVFVEQDKCQGFIVRAYENIPEYTLICEYTGEVDFARNRIFDKNDSIMDLLRTTRSFTSLVICPEKYGNLARFISGINNFKKEDKAKQNLQSIRFNIDNHARVLLYSKRPIKAGEILYYDYNAGGFGEYPTEEFI